MPDEVFSKPRGVKLFIYGSTLHWAEEQEKANKKGGK